MATPVRDEVIEGAAALPIEAERYDRASPHVVVTVNGPGEVAAWLYPFARALRARLPYARLTVALLPCRFASGREQDVVANMPEIDRLLRPNETLRLIWNGGTPFAEAPADAVLHLGGELLLSIRLARQAGVPIVTYEEERIRWPSLVDRVCVRDAGCRGASDARVRIVGNLMVDAAHLRVPARSTTRSARQTIALFPGSRPYFVHQLLPLFLRVAGILQRERPGLEFVLAKSDFISPDDLRASLANLDRVVEGDNGTLRHVRDRWTIDTETGVEVDVAAPGAAMQRADLAITIPGTNTAELAALGIPMVLVLPTYRLHALPLPGLAGHIGGVPILGPMIKEAVAQIYLRTRRLWAHPNRLAGEMIVPELIGRLTAPIIAERVGHALDGRLESVSQRLRLVMGSVGAADRLVDEVLELAGVTQ